MEFGSLGKINCVVVGFVGASVEICGCVVFCVKEVGCVLFKEFKG